MIENKNLPSYGGINPPSNQFKSTGKRRDLVAFFVAGWCNNFGFVVMLSAAEDIIEKNSEIEDFIVPTGAVLLAGILPALFVKVTAPWIMDRLNYNLRICLLMLFGFASFHVVAWFQSSVVNLAGVCLGSLAAAFGEITFLALSSRYHKNTVSTWSSGTGMAGLAGSGFYLCFTSWFRITFNITLVVASVAPIIVGISYFVVLTDPSPIARPVYSNITRSMSDSDMTTSATAKRTVQDIVDDERSGSVVQTRAGDEAWSDRSSDHWAGEDDEENLVSPSNRNESHVVIPLRKKLRILLLLMPYMIPLFLVYFAEYTINQGVSPVLVFKDAPFEKRDHYVYYMFLYQLGVFISRSSVNFAPINHISVPSFLQLGNLIFLVLNTLLGLIKDVYIIFAVIFWEGLLGGAVYVNAFYLITQEVSPAYREFSLGLASVADSLGICLAGLVAVFLEPWLAANRAEF